MLKMLGVGSGQEVVDVKGDCIVFKDEKDNISHVMAKDRLMIPRKRALYTPDLKKLLAGLTYTVQGMYEPGVNKQGVHFKGSKAGKRKANNNKAMNINSTRTPAKDGGVWAMFAMSPPHSIIKSDISEKTYTVTQEVDLGVIHITSGSAPTFSTEFFVASSLDQVATFTALFDQYRVNWIELWVEPLQTSNVVTNLASVIDYDDATNLATYAQALDYNNVVVAPLTNGHHRVFTPHVAVAMYSGAFTSFGNEISPWIDAASTGVQHYGVKLAAETSTGTYSIHGRFRVNVSWRNCR